MGLPTPRLPPTSSPTAAQIAELARSLLALEHATSPTRAREADTLALRLLHALEVARIDGVPVERRQRALVYQAIAAYEAIRDV